MNKWKMLKLWVTYFKILLRLSWEARDEPANRAKVRRIVRSAVKSLD